MDSSHRNGNEGSSSRVDNSSSRRIGNDDSDRSLSPARSIPTPSDPGIQEINERYRDRPPPGPSPTSPQFVDAPDSPTAESPRRTAGAQRRRAQSGPGNPGSQAAEAVPSASHAEENVASGTQGGILNTASSAVRSLFGSQADDSTRQSNGRGNEDRGLPTQNNTGGDTGAAAGRPLYPDISAQAQTASMGPSPPTTGGTSQTFDGRGPSTSMRNADVPMQDAPPIRNASRPARQDREAAGIDGDQPPPPVRRGYREGWACDDGMWKQVVAYRLRGSGHQVMLKERAPNRQYWKYEWVAAHRVGGAAVVNGYIAHMRSSGVDEVETFRTGSIDLLREMIDDDYEGIIGIAPVRRYQHNEFGWRRMPAQDVQVKFRGQRDPVWYPKSEIARQFGREVIEGDIADFWQRSGIDPPVMNPPDLIGPRQTNGARRSTRNQTALSPSEPEAQISRRPPPQQAQQQYTHQQDQQQVQNLAQTRRERSGIVNRIAVSRRGLITPEHTPAPERPSDLEQTPSADAEFQTLQNILRRRPELLGRVRNMGL